ncbi:MAG: DUF2061 domain-containing protein [Phycisphaerae bacterium]
MESHYRSIVKAITWRAGGTVVTFAVAWIITGNISLSAGIGILDTVIKIVAYYVHERFWIRVKFGKLKRPEYEI